MPVVWSAIGASVLPNVGGWIGAAVVRPNLKWYDTLDRPTWRPPNWAFGPVWTALYTGMGYASYLVWRDGGGFGERTIVPLSLYASQLALNWVWSPIFFGAHNVSLALVDIGLLWVNVAACGYSFYEINQLAGYLMIPYMGWLTLASALNYYIYKKNKSPKDTKEIKEK